MKNLLTLLTCVIFIVAGYAQKSKEDAPAAAKSAFAAKYPDARKVIWSVEKPGEFEVEFTLNKVESSALFDAAGKFLEAETEIRESDLPQDVRTTIAKDFVGFKLDEIEKATDEKGITTYEMEAVKGKEKFEISFDTNGRLLSKEPLKDEKEDEKK